MLDRQQILDKRYATTRLAMMQGPELIRNPENKFESLLFLPEGEKRQGEGGLRTKGYYKRTLANKPLTTVITAVFNGEDFLEESIKSVINQLYDNVEYLIIDGGSTDGTLDIIKKYEHAIDYWVSEQDSGIYDAWNKAISISGDGWALFLGADDILQSPEVLRIAAESLDALSFEIKVAYGKIAVVDDFGHTVAIKGEPWDIAGKNFTSTMTLPHQGVFHHYSLFQEFGNYNTELKIVGDYELLLRVLPTSPPYFISDLVVASWKVGGVSYNVETPLLVASELSQARQMNGFNSISMALIIFYLKAYVLRGLFLLFGFSFATQVANFYRKITGQWRWG